MERLPGFYRQRDNRMYSTLSFITPVTLLRLPYSFAIALVWSAMVYYPCNLAPEASRFFTFLLLLFLLHKCGPRCAWWPCVPSDVPLHGSTGLLGVPCCTGPGLCAWRCHLKGQCM